MFSFGHRRSWSEQTGISRYGCILVDEIHSCESQSRYGCILVDEIHSCESQSRLFRNLMLQKVPYDECVFIRVCVCVRVRVCVCACVSVRDVSLRLRVSTCV